MKNILKFFPRRLIKKNLIRHIWEQKQLKTFDETLLRIHRCDKHIYDSETTKRVLAGKQKSRRSFRDRKDRIHVIAFGFKDWEAQGLWPSFSKVSDFKYCGLGELSEKHGITTVGPNQRRTLEKACLEYVDDTNKISPVDMVFFYVDTECVSPYIFRELGRRGVWTVLMGLDDKHRFYPRRENNMIVGQATVAPHVDLIWTTWKSGADLFLECGGNPWYAPEAADPEFHHPMNLERDIDILFLGQKYGRRPKLVRYLEKQGFHIETFGKGWPTGFVSFEESVRLINRAKIVLGIGDVLNTSEVQHLKGRDFEVPMCGAVYLTTYNPELADWFDIGREILCYSSFRNCAEILHWILRRPEKQEEIRQAALRCSLADHTWETRLREMLSLFPN